MKRLVVFSIFGIFIVSVLVTGLFLKQQFFDAMSGDKTEVVFEVPPAKSFLAVAKDLETQGFIRSALMFNYYARFTGQRDKIKVGEYALNKAMNSDEILKVIVSGKSISRAFTISEGLNIYEIAGMIEAQGLGQREEFLNLVKNPKFVKELLGFEAPSLEGYLFPETYMLTKFNGLETLVRKMHETFRQVFSEIAPLASNVGLTAAQVVVLASIIEKETGAEWERPLISSVFHNRLKKGMRLQTDPTIIYGMADEKNELVSKISKSDITRPTRYNTYVINGLPPGPIANPGKEALLAAVKPESSDYLFFVSKNDGTHIFSENYADHNKAVESFQKNPEARRGKSWRDLQKEKTK